MLESKLNIKGSDSVELSAQLQKEVEEKFSCIQSKIINGVKLENSNQSTKETLEKCACLEARLDAMDNDNVDFKVKFGKAIKRVSENVEKISVLKYKIHRSSPTSVSLSSLASDVYKIINIFDELVGMLENEE